MENICFEDLILLLKSYNQDEINKVTLAYNFAKEKHNDQVRQSGEPYIIHPLNVAYILEEMHADGDTICAGLLHDTIEDTNTSKEEIADLFNSDIANLVDGVTKLSKMNYSSRDDLNVANTRKIIIGLTNDVRIIIIKLADRLHNMRTLQYKTEFKQKENAIETMEIFVPLAYYIGAYKIKSELEDLSLQYLKPDMYKNICDKRNKIEIDSKPYLENMLESIKIILDDKMITNDIRFRIKNIYGIYKKLSEGHKISEIHDLLALKIMVDNISNCYETLGLVHCKYHPINDKFKDYICNPKTNMYQSLHTTVFGPNDKIIQMQIRTFDMDKIDTYGLTTYWELNKGNARYLMQNDLKTKFQFYKSLTDIDILFKDNMEFIDQVKEELFSKKIYVYTSKGDIIELPYGSSVIDFAYKIHTDIGNTMVGAIVNDEYVPVDYILKNKDRVKILTDSLSFGSHEEWEKIVKTSNARRKIREFNRK